jgi:hypothetical protein
MNSNTTLIMFAVIAAFGLATATLVVPVVHQAHAFTGKECQDMGYVHGGIGKCVSASH